LLFAPVLECLLAGQIGILLLLSVALFLFMEQSGRSGLAGFALIACTLKPHLFVLFGLVLLAWIAYRRVYRVAIGFSIALLVTGSLAYWLDPHAWTQWAELLRLAKPTEPFVPNLSKMLRLLVHRESVWIQFVPLVAGCGWAGWYFWTRRRCWNWLDHGMVLLVVSVGCAPYSWFTDEAMLLPAVLIAAFRAKAAGSSILPFLLTFTVLLAEIATGLTMTTAYLVWSIPGYLLLVLLAKWAEARPKSVDFLGQA
jgi:glycosyl transferase family 87